MYKAKGVSPLMNRATNLVRPMYMYMYIPSEAAQCFSLSAFGLCLTYFPLCIYMYEIDHVRVRVRVRVRVCVHVRVCVRVRTAVHVYVFF